MVPLVVMLLVAGAVAALARGGTHDQTADEGAATVPARSALHRAAAAFLDHYVVDGRVVRIDQGGDTVSEGQAYAMLLAAAVGDRTTFDDIWRWSQDHLLRPDGLLSWRWQNGAVVDQSSASDADLDAARALVVASDVFDDPQLERQGVALGRAVLDHETVSTGHGLVLVAGQWATSAPYAFNPSYVSPVAFDLLARHSGDPRWARLDAGSRAVMQEVTAPGQLPPDWASVQSDGSAAPAPGPQGEPVQFGYDAARALVWHAESCDPQDRRYAAQAGSVIADEVPAASTYDLAGSPQTSDHGALASVSQAAALAAEGDASHARAALQRGAEESHVAPTYYGDAWAALGPILLDTTVLGGCPVLAGTE